MCLCGCYFTLNPARLASLAMKQLFLCLFLCLTGQKVSAQTPIRLYGNPPGVTSQQTDRLSKNRVDTTSLPMLTAYLPDAAVATGTGVLLLPGNNLEATAVIRQLTTKGVAAFVVGYPSMLGGQVSRDSAEAMVLVAGTKALAYLRQHTAELGIQTDRIGVLGFSTGARVALMLGYDSTTTRRLAFVGLIQADMGTLVTSPVPSNAPPLFIVSNTGTPTTSGSVVSDARQVAIRAAQLYQQWLGAGRSAELHSYAAGQPTGAGSSAIWLDRWLDWLNERGYLEKRTVIPPVSAPAANGQTASVPSPAPAAVKVRPEPAVSTSPFNLPQISGTVRDSATGRPLAGVAIVLDYRKRITGTTTDVQGHYALELPTGNHILVARLIGYTPVRKEVRLTGGQVTVDVALISVASQLEEVVVTTKGFDQTIRQPMLGVSQLNINALKKLPSALGEVDLLRGLQLLPGVTSVGEASNGVNIRGGTTDQNLILLDDTPIFNPTHMFGLFSVFPPDALSTVDLYKGNVPARFGGRAASVLDVALRNPTLDQFSLSGGVSVVSNKLTADIPIVKGKLGLLDRKSVV